MLNVSDRLAVDVALETGATSETVAVEAAPLEVNLQNAAVEGLITVHGCRPCAPYADSPKDWPGFPVNCRLTCEDLPAADGNIAVDRVQLDAVANSPDATGGLNEPLKKPPKFLKHLSFWVALYDSEADDWPRGWTPSGFKEFRCDSALMLRSFGLPMVSAMRKIEVAAFLGAAVAVIL
jgi:hypothetical protein